MTAPDDRRPDEPPPPPDDLVGADTTSPDAPVETPAPRDAADLAAEAPAVAAEAPPSAAAEPSPPPRRPGFFEERDEVPVEEHPGRLAAQSRRGFLWFAAGVVASAAGAWWLLPDRRKGRLTGSATRDQLDSLAARVGLSRGHRERVLNRALTFDDDVAEALYSERREVRTYDRLQRTPLKNNYHGRTPGPEILPGWTLTLSGLASGRDERLTLDDLLRRLPRHEQCTRLVCVEGWSAIAWWGGPRFADLLAAFPPARGARWAALRSEVSLDGAGNREPYYVSLDLGTARHPQTLLATHQDGAPLTLAHGAPLRLLAPVKLGLKNIKAITHIAYTAAEPADYWHERGYSRYDGL